MDGQEIAALGDIDRIITIETERIIQDNIDIPDLLNFNCYFNSDGT